MERREFHLNNRFFDYCFDGRVEEMKEALEAGADPNFTTGHYRYLSALMEATHWGNYEAVDLLLAQPGINVNHQCSWGWTALHHAVDRSSVAILKRLLQAPGILVNEKGRLGRTPIMVAARSGFTEAVYLLAAVEEVDLDVKDDLGNGLEEIARDR